MGGTYATTADFENAMRTAFIAEYCQTPEDFIKDYERVRYDLNAMPIGVVLESTALAVVICVSIIAGLVLILGVISAALDYVARIKTAKYTAPADSSDGAVSDEENDAINDYYKKMLNNNKDKEDSSILPIIALGALLLMNNNKKSNNNKKK